MAKKSAKQQDGGLLAASSWADQMASDQEDPDRDISSDPPQNTLAFSQAQPTTSFHPIGPGSFPDGFQKMMADMFQQLVLQQQEAKEQELQRIVNENARLQLRLAELENRSSFGTFPMAASSSPSRNIGDSTESVSQNPALEA